MAQAARFSIWKRGFESRWGRRADLPTCGLLRVPRLGGRAYQFNGTICSLCPGGRASGYELDWRGSTPRREANPSAPRSHARRPAPVLVARDTSLEACCPGSIPGRGAAGRDGPIRGSYPRPCRFNSCSAITRRLEASGGSHKAVRGGSTPPVAISFSGCGSIWQSTGSGHRGLEVQNPPIQTDSAVKFSLGVAQSGQSTGSGNRGLGVQNPSTQTARGEQAGECAGSTNRARRVRSLASHHNGFRWGRTVR